MTDKSQSNQGPQGDYYPPPPSGPPPGHNGLAMHPNEQYSPESPSELYDNPYPYPNPTSGPPPLQQTPHQPPPPDSDGTQKKAGWGQRMGVFGSKAAVPLNMLANKLGSEAFLPSTIDKECEKAARILRSFCKDGIYTDNAAPETVEAPTTDKHGKPTTAPAKPKKNRTLLTIPSKVINKAVALAIFTTARAAFHVSGATGSGVIVARLPDGSWSPPSGIQVHSVGAGFVIGLDIYDCVVVINTKEALQAFTKTRMSLGSDLAVVAGPWGAGGSVDFAAPSSQKDKGKDGHAPEATEATKVADGRKPATTTPTTDGKQTPAGTQTAPSGLKQAIKQPTYSYVKSRGFYAGVRVDGTIVTERKDANAQFYGEPVSVQNILEGRVPLVPGRESWVNIAKPLFDTIKGAEGRHSQQDAGAGWTNQQGGLGPDQTPPHGHGNAPSAGYTAGYDPVYSKPASTTGTTEENRTSPNREPPAAGVANLNLGGSTSAAASSAGAAAPAETPAARSKAAEAAAEHEANREREETERRELEQETAAQRQRPLSDAPPYTELAGQGGSGHGDGSRNDEQPPPYVDDGQARPSDTKGGGYS